MNRRRTTALLVSLFVLVVSFPASRTSAEPILKPKKYHGPIPKRSFTFSIGFLGGPENEEMYSFLETLDPRISQPLRKEMITDDFGPALQADLTYTAKVHPNFAFRLKSGAAFLSSSSQGLLIPTAEEDPGGLSPLLRFDRSFDVTLVSLEASGLYYFQDASVAEFQTYAGGGFSLYMPIMEWEEVLVDDDTGAAFGSSRESDSPTAAGVHGILGLLYHISPSLAIHLEGRGQIVQSKFTLELPTDSGIQPITFDVDYTGFVLNVGVSKFL